MSFLLELRVDFQSPLPEPGIGDGAILDPSCSVRERECRGQSSGWMMDDMREKGWVVGRMLVDVVPDELLVRHSMWWCTLLTTLGFNQFLVWIYSPLGWAVQRLALFWISTLCSRKYLPSSNKQLLFGVDWAPMLTDEAYAEVRLKGGLCEIWR